MCAKSCPTAPLFETATFQSEKYLQGKENNIYQHDLKLMAVPELTGSTDVTVWFTLSKPTILWFCIHFHLALITSIKQLPMGHTWYCNCTEVGAASSTQHGAVSCFMRTDRAACCQMKSLTAKFCLPCAQQGHQLSPSLLPCYLLQN